jgi:hypothetical protein
MNLYFHTTKKKEKENASGTGDWETSTPNCGNSNMSHVTFCIKHMACVLMQKFCSSLVWIQASSFALVPGLTFEPRPNMEG